jgi:cyclic pyranopterin phosphate synthase
LTTNGSQLPRFSDDVASFGVKRVNISRATLDTQKFKDITPSGHLSKVLDGIQAAQEAGIRVKINMVALKGTNEDELEDVIRWCADKDMDITFIEVMPMGDMGEEDRIDQYWALSDLRKRIAKTWELTDIPLNTGGPARYVRLNDTGQKIGFITPLTHNFCESCNRVRLTCTGQLFQCLGQEKETDLRKSLRDNPDNDAPVVDAIHAAIALKPKGHDFSYDRKEVAGEMTRHMSHTGG